MIDQEGGIVAIRDWTGRRIVYIWLAAQKVEK